MVPARRESVIGGTAKINRKTSYSITRSDGLSLDVIGAFYDTDRSDYSPGWGAFANPTGKPGWNSVTITVICRGSDLFAAATASALHPEVAGGSARLTATLTATVSDLGVALLQ